MPAGVSKGLGQILVVCNVCSEFSDLLLKWSKKDDFTGSTEHLLQVDAGNSFFYFI